MAFTSYITQEAKGLLASLLAGDSASLSATCRLGSGSAADTGALALQTDVLGYVKDAPVTRAAAAGGKLLIRVQLNSDGLAESSQAAQFAV